MKTSYILLVIAICFFGVSCTKEFLDEKPKSSLMVPKTLADLRALMDDPYIFISSGSPSLAWVSSDDFVAPDNYVKTLSATEREAYLWEKAMGGNDLDWFYCYQQIFNANIVLDRLPEIEAQNKEYVFLKGTALFWRSFAFYNLLENYAKPFNIATESADLGVPLRLTSDVNIRMGRGTVKEGFERIISDLKTAVELLPVNEKYNTRPTRNSATALLARIYLTMGDFRNAGIFADLSLKLNDRLLHYRELDANKARPFPLGISGQNQEIILYTCMTKLGFIKSALVGVVPELYRQYQNGDLRKEMYFESKGKELYVFKGSYTGNNDYFGGLTTREQYLIRAECFAREGKIELAMNDLNKLLASRWDNSFKPLTVTDKEDVLALILRERRKELVGQGLRFSDLRRLNQEQVTATTLRRKFDGKEYLLPPNDIRYVFLIPEQEIQLTGIEQNIR
ncbi:MAG: RagB/SusD family nutrient uptake outer membrane protein [Sphingobacterium sp.]|jgi:tetratricopeptide (TPR) repeat protein|nr:RagB/SusD family nutrient uptake outer membrane protein [Sphingobacterium sp.]